MPYAKNYFIYALFVTLVTYTAYTFLWTRFGLVVTTVVQYVLLFLVFCGVILYLLKPSYFKNAWTNWLIILWITQVLAFYFSNSSATTQFKESTFILLTVAPIISMQYNPKHIKWLFITMALVSIAMYFVVIFMLRLVDEDSYGGGYLILATMPVFLYFFRDKGVCTQMIIIIILFVLVLTSMKRGDILAYTLAIAVYYYIKLKNSGKFDYKILLTIGITTIVCYFAFKYLLATNDIFAWRFEQTIEGDSSKRDIIYSTLWNHFLNAPYIVQLFGGGFDATLKIVETRAHSDILEVLSCEGIIGLIIYLGAFISLYRQIRQRKNVSEKAILASILAIWFVKSIFSMFIYSQPTIILFALTGYILNNRIDKHYEY